MGKSIAEYEATVGELNKQAHETSELLILQKEGILPLDPDEDEQPGAGRKQKKARRRSR